MPLLDFNNIFLVKKDQQGKDVSILKGLSFEVKDGEIFALAGPSGSGKSSVLRLINRLDDSTSGELYVDGKEIREWDVVKLREKVGFVFQESALFEGTVMENVLYGLCLRGLQKCDHEPTAQKLLSKVGLSSELMHRSVDSLSGGQKQRVNLARTLALEPEIILMDEPTSALDPAAAKNIEALIMDLNQEFNKTIVVVSHNLEQIQRIAHRCAILDEGQLMFTGTPEELFETGAVLDKLTNGKVAEAGA